VRQPLNDSVQNLRTRCFTQRGKLFQGIFGLPSAASVIHTDQHHFFESKLAVLNLGDVFEFRGKSDNSAKALTFFTVQVPPGRGGKGTGEDLGGTTEYADGCRLRGIRREDAVYRISRGRHVFSG
jgi:hypothetical protein